MTQSNSRRHFIKTTAVLAVGSLASTAFSKSGIASTLFGNSFGSGDTKFTLPALHYRYNALEPHIDALTMEIHHSKHHQAYVNNLNKAMEGLDFFKLGIAPTLPGMFANMSKLPDSIRNNAGGHYNHSIFWHLMKPIGEKAPIGTLADAISKQYGSFDEFKKQFTEASKTLFGSGWAWLIWKNGKLVITTTANQDNPLMQVDGITQGTPILALDVWEHAYYLKNENRRMDYISAWWNVVNWELAEDFYVAAGK